MIKKLKIVLVTLFLTCVCVENVFGLPFRADVSKTEYRQKKIRMNDSILYSLLIKNNVLYPEIVIAQARIETGNYTSNLCVNGNNLFGIKLRGKYAHFSNYEESVLAYKNKIQYKLKPNEDYYHFLKRINYASSPKYICKVKSVAKQIKVPYVTA